jgi:hypothetical protein
MYVTDILQNWPFKNITILEELQQGSVPKTSSLALEAS